MPWVVAAAVGGAVVSGVVGSKASSDASEAQTESADKGLAAQKAMFDTIRGDFSPWRTTGMNALAALSKSLGIDSGGGFQASEGYQFALGEGVKAVDAGAANKGLISSGARAKALTKFGTGLANQEYYNYLNQLRGVSQAGSAAAGMTASAGQNYANNATDLFGAQGQASANNSINQANIVGDTLATLGTKYATGSGNSSAYDGTTMDGPSSSLDTIFKLNW